MARQSNGLLVVGVLVVAVLLLTGTVKIPTFAAAGPPSPLEQAQLCPDTQATNLKVAYKKKDNSILQYETATFDVYRSGVAIGTVATGEAAGLSTTALSVDCGASYDVIYRGSSSFDSVAKLAVVATGANKEVYFDGSRTSQVEYLLYDTGFNNETIGDGTSGDFGQDETSTTNTAFSTGTRKDYYLQVRAQTSAATFGTPTSILNLVSTGVNNLLCVDYNTAKFDKASGITVVGSHIGAVVDPTSYASSQGMDKCWVLDPIKSSDGTLQWNIGLYSNLGDPGDTDNPKFQAFDAQIYKTAAGSLAAA